MVNFGVEFEARSFDQALPELVYPSRKDRFLTLEASKTGLNPQKTLKSQGQRLLVG
jgi:hypothetical protein